MSNEPKRDDLERATVPIQDLGAMGAQFAQVTARCQGEYLNLFSRRAAAYLEIPERLSHCKTPVDLWREQISFLATMQRHYFEATQNLMAAAIQESAAMESEEGGTQATPESLPRSATPRKKDDSSLEHIERRAA